MQRLLTPFTAFVFIVLLGSSCVVSNVSYGNYEQMECDQHQVIKDKNVYLFWHMVKVNETKLPNELQDYKVEKNMNLYDIVVTAGTLGLFSTETVKIKVKDCANATEPVSAD